MVRIALDTNTIFDYSNYLKEYNGNITQYDIRDLVDNKKEIINDFINNLESIFHNPEVKKINFNNPKFPDYFSINEMYIDMIKSGQLTEKQLDTVVQQLKNNYKQFTNNYPKLINYDVISRRKVNNPIFEHKISDIILNNSDNYKSIISNFEEISYKSELVRMFELAKGDNPEVEFVITQYVEREVFAHIKGTKENREANELWKRNNPGVPVREVKTFDGNIIRNIIKNCSFYDFSKKARERVSMLVNAIKSDANKVGVNNKPNSLGYDGDPECVASAQCLGLMLVSRNMKDMKGKGINIDAKRHSNIAHEYLSAKGKASAVSKDGKTTLGDIVKESIEKIESYKNDEISQIVYKNVNEITCDTNRQSEIVEASEVLDKSKIGTLEEKPKLLGLKVTHKMVNEHVVEDDIRQYKSTYKMQASNTIQQNSNKTSNINDEMGMDRR